MTVKKSKLIKVLFTRRGEDPETAWCTKVAERAGRLHARLDNILFLHERPVWGDVIEVSPDREGVLVYRKIVRAGGRYAAILEYFDRAALKPLVALLARRGIQSELFAGPRGDSAGMLFLAVPHRVKPRALYQAVSRRFAGLGLTHPPQRGIPTEAAAPAPVKSALIDAVRAGDLRAARAALRAGAALEARDGECGDSALVLAAKKGRGALVALLLAAGARANARNDYGQSAMHWAVRSGDVPLYRRLRKAGAKLDPDSVFIAVCDGQEAMLRALLADGVSPNLRREGSTLIFATALRNRPRLAELLLRAGARADVRDRDGDTPLAIAEEYGSKAAARVLAAASSRKR